MGSTTVVRQESDAQLIAAARTGDSEAYAELYRRHVDAARAAARSLARSRSDADDITSEAFARVLRILQAGGGPEVSFRPYLVTVVRNVFYDRVRRTREQPSDEMGDIVHDALTDAADNRAEGALAAAAFATLPERWQLVLWHTEVEGRTASEVAPLLGLAPNAVAALAYRAREGLRQAYLQAHLREQHEAECRECSANLGAYVRDGLSARDRRKVDAHLDTCDHCRGLVAELAATNTTLRAALIPALIGTTAAAYLGALGGKGLLAWFLHLPKRTQVAAGGGTAAAVVAAAALAAASFGGGSPSAASSTVPGTDGTVTVAPTAGGTAEPATPTESTVESAPPVTTVAPATTRPPATMAPVPLPPPRTPTTAAPTRPTTRPSTTVATTVPATVPPPVLAAVAEQRTTALAGGDVQIAVTVTNSGGVATGLQVGVPVPTGATFARAEALRSHAPSAAVTQVLAPGWTCAGTVTCTLPSLPAGASSTLLLTFTLAPGAPDSLTFQPSVPSPAGASVTVTPVTIAVAHMPGLLVAETAHGEIVAIGNTVLTCNGDPGCAEAQDFAAADNDHNAYTMQYVATAGGTFDSSSAQLTVTGTVARAVLVWGGDTAAGAASAPDPAARGTVSFTTPTGTSAVVADQVVDTTGGTYMAAADVTGLVAGSGTYSVADVQVAAGQAGFGGWSLVVVVHDPALPQRLLVVALPMATLATNGPVEVAAPLLAPMTGATASVIAVGFEGDPGLTGDQIDVGGVVTANAFRAQIAGTRDPATPNTFGTDVALVGATGLTGDTFRVTASTSNDRVQVALVAFALGV